jgi:hypothetical protein
MNTRLCFAHFALALALLSGSAALSQSGAEARLATGFNAISQKNLRADLTFLASDALEGRMSLQRGSEAAIQFIAAEFAKAGLRPLVGESYLQPIEMIEYKPDVRGMRLTLERGGSQQQYKYITDFIGSFPLETTVSAPVAFVGYGITAPEFGYDDYANIDARGKIVLVFDHEPQENDPKSVFNGIGNTRHANSRLKVLNAQKHGAVGVLLVSEPNRKHPSNQERLARIPGILERMTRNASQALADSETKIPLLTVSDALATTLLAPTGKKPAELQSAIDGSLKPQSQPLADTRVEMRIVNAEHRRAMTANVLGMIEGSDPALKNETIIFSGHYDHDGIREGKILYGADDNGSGTVTLLGIAKAFATGPKTKRSVAFIWHAGEERGLLGSRYNADYPAIAIEKTVANLNMDMVGRNRDDKAEEENTVYLVGSDRISTELHNLTLEANTSLARPLRLDFEMNDPTDLEQVYYRSDHYSYAAKGIPIVFFTTGLHGDYHFNTDSVEKINFEKMARIGQLVYETGRRVANLDHAPARDNKGPRVGKGSNGRLTE